MCLVHYGHNFDHNFDHNQLGGPISHRQIGQNTQIDSVWIVGGFRGSNPGPLAPKARIMPLDQIPCAWHEKSLMRLYPGESKKGEFQVGVTA